MYIEEIHKTAILKVTRIKGPVERHGQVDKKTTQLSDVYEYTQQGGKKGWKCIQGPAEVTPA